MSKLCKNIRSDELHFGGKYRLGNDEAVVNNIKENWKGRDKKSAEPPEKKKRQRSPYSVRSTSSFDAEHPGPFGDNFMLALSQAQQWMETYGTNDPNLEAFRCNVYNKIRLYGDEHTMHHETLLREELKLLYRLLPGNIVVKPDDVPAWTQLDPIAVQERRPSEAPVPVPALLGEHEGGSTLSETSNFSAIGNGTSIMELFNSPVMVLPPPEAPGPGYEPIDDCRYLAAPNPSVIPLPVPEVTQSHVNERQSGLVQVPAGTERSRTGVESAKVATTPPSPVRSDSAQAETAVDSPRQWEQPVTKPIQNSCCILQ